MFQQLEKVDNIRQEINNKVTKKEKNELSQFMTPKAIAQFMVALFPTFTEENCRLLDAGAGIGTLSCAFIDRWMAGDFSFKSMITTAYEIDKNLCIHLEKHLMEYKGLTYHVINDDYVKLATVKNLTHKKYTHVILNPPYKKINSKSAHRLALRKVGIETVNLYSAFVALAITETANKGQIVAIIPRSFCNGPYYRSFRNFILKKTAIKHIHLFKSRRKAFKDDKVLQENIIIRLECGGLQEMVTISTSTDDSFSDLQIHQHPFNRIVFQNDPQQFIHIPTSTEQGTLETSSKICCTLEDLNIKVSTGPIVDFRLKAHLCNMPQEGSVPLLYPIHINNTNTLWPIKNIKKANAIMRNADTEKWLYPNGFYCIVKRFSSKEEKRRITAAVVDPKTFGNTLVLGFENHLNLFHNNKQGLSEALVHGLAMYLNSTAVDEHFRKFNGHTQVNVADLKLMKYPSREILIKLGNWAMKQKEITQYQIDTELENIII
ncbi:Eco57I restriction-modification methylase domain-containing protein [Arsenophonus nasoniae]|uniref:site-specific DNA-methyltransferase (adenine-specific) n=1 Tax=Arsenophonus nasoniae TaxID=638 RepID=A0AA95K7W6_9GAMM|nr:Eco57I restriction-modification methylase domain-containing protein [Arsenophonus nasoniae]WGL95297.1 Eco57I restriction-modification methylase domain-containing protein [Arsenophonus nasoniae]